MEGVTVAAHPLVQHKLTLIRDKGMPNAVIAHHKTGRFDLARLKGEAGRWPGLVGLDLVPEVTTGQSYAWDEMRWAWGQGYRAQPKPEFHVVAIDYGLKRNKIGRAHV